MASETESESDSKTCRPTWLHVSPSTLIDIMQTFHNCSARPVHSPLKGHTSCVSCLAVLSNGVLASGSYDGTIKVWDVKTGVCQRTLSGHERGISTIVALPNGMLVSVSIDKTVKLWDVFASKCIRTFFKFDRIDVLVALSRGRLAHASPFKFIVVWNYSTGRVQYTLKGHTGVVRALAVLSDERLASASSDKTIRIWDLSNDDAQCTKILNGHANPIYQLAVLSKGRLVSSCEGIYDESMRVWDVSTAKCVHTLKTHVSTFVALPSGSIAYSPNGNDICVWNPSVFQTPIVKIIENMYIASLVVLPNGCLVSGNEDDTIHVYDMPASQLVVADYFKQQMLKVLMRTEMLPFSRNVLNIIISYLC